MPSFLFDTPEPLQVGSLFSSSLNDLKKLGFTGDNVFMGGHSLGGVMAQGYAQKNTNVIKGMILEGSVLLRSTRSVQENGFTKFTSTLPTLTLCAELDGLLRLTRCIESLWHSTENIDPSQKDLFPVMGLKGLSHWRFSSGPLPGNVLNNDLKPEITEADAHKQIAMATIGFFAKVLGNNRATSILNQVSTIDLKPLLEAMK